MSAEQIDDLISVIDAAYEEFRRGCVVAHANPLGRAAYLAAFERTCHNARDAYDAVCRYQNLCRLSEERDALLRELACINVLLVASARIIQEELS